MSPDTSSLVLSVGLAIAGGLGIYFGVGLAFELAYYRRRDRASEWKCQPKRWPSPKARRDEILLGAANLTVASIASGLFVHAVKAHGASALYASSETHGVGYSLASGALYLVLTDFALYWAHRLFHTPWLYRRVHRVHHRWVSPTAFTSMAMHPVEFATYQSVMIMPLFFVPLHAGAVVFTLLFTNWYALVDHSGVRMRSWLPFVAPSPFHDDHHAHFHVNYGQSFALWDRVFGSHRRRGRSYGEAVFGGQGAPSGDDAGPAPLWDYGKRAERATGDTVPEARRPA